MRQLTPPRRQTTNHRRDWGDHYQLLNYESMLHCCVCLHRATVERSGSATPITVAHHMLQAVCCNAAFPGSPVGVSCTVVRNLSKHRACTAQPGARALYCVCARCAGYPGGSQMVLPYTPARRNVPFRRTNYEQRAKTCMPITSVSSPLLQHPTSGRLWRRPCCH